MEVAFPEIVGPFEVAGAGHFLMWERAACLQPCTAYSAWTFWHNRRAG